MMVGQYLAVGIEKSGIESVRVDVDIEHYRPF